MDAGVTGEESKATIAYPKRIAYPLSKTNKHAYIQTALKGSNTLFTDLTDLFPQLFLSIVLLINVVELSKVPFLS